MDHACGPGVRPVPAPPLMKDKKIMTIVERIQNHRPAASAHQVGRKWKSIQTRVGTRRVSRTMCWLGKDIGDTEPATKKRPASKAAAAAKTKAKILIVKRPAAVHSAKPINQIKTKAQSTNRLATARKGRSLRPPAENNFEATDGNDCTRWVCIRQEVQCRGMEQT